MYVTILRYSTVWELRSTFGYNQMKRGGLAMCYLVFRFMIERDVWSTASFSGSVGTVVQTWLECQHEEVSQSAHQSIWHSF